MYNKLTGQLGQIKLKNTKDAGCTGTKIVASSIGIADDILVARLPYQYSNNYDSEWSIYGYTIIVGPIIETSAFGCVHVDSLLPDGRRAGDVKIGDKLELGDEKVFDEVEKKFKSSTGIVTFSKRVAAAGFRIRTASGASLVCSDTAPIPTRTGLVLAPRLFDHFVPVKTSIAGGVRSGWEQVVSVEAVGQINVQHITVGDKCFWAGETEDAFILHHNLKALDIGPPEAFWPWW